MRFYSLSNFLARNKNRENSNAFTVKPKRFPVCRDKNKWNFLLGEQSNTFKIRVYVSGGKAGIRSIKECQMTALGEDRCQLSPLIWRWVASGRVLGPRLEKNDGLSWQWFDGFCKPRKIECVCLAAEIRQKLGLNSRRLEYERMIHWTWLVLILYGSIGALHQDSLGRKISGFPFCFHGP